MPKDFIMRIYWIHSPVYHKCPNFIVNFNIYSSGRAGKRGIEWLLVPSGVGFSGKSPHAARNPHRREPII